MRWLLFVSAFKKIFLCLMWSELLEWYQKNKRDLPWRNTQDPYFIWLSAKA
jgi:adenine-specific DNA glycosylase